MEGKPAQRGVSGSQPVVSQLWTSIRKMHVSSQTVHPSVSHQLARSMNEAQQYLSPMDCRTAGTDVGLKPTVGVRGCYFSNGYLKHMLFLFGEDLMI